MLTIALKDVLYLEDHVKVRDFLLERRPEFFGITCGIQHLVSSERSQSIDIVGKCFIAAVLFFECFPGVPALGFSLLFGSDFKGLFFFVQVYPWVGNHMLPILSSKKDTN